MAQLVKNLPEKQETWVGFRGWEDPLEKRKVTHSSILAWRIPWTLYSPWGHKESDRLSDFHFQVIELRTTTCVCLVYISFLHFTLVYPAIMQKSRTRLSD